MCMFCATVPAIAATGISMNSQQKQKERAALVRGETPKRPRIAIAPATYLAMVALLIASIVYHSQGNA